MSSDTRIYNEQSRSIHYQIIHFGGWINSLLNIDAFKPETRIGRDSSNNNNPNIWVSTCNESINKMVYSNKFGIPGTPNQCPLSTHWRCSVLLSTTHISSSSAKPINNVCTTMLQSKTSIRNGHESRSYIQNENGDEKAMHQKWTSRIHQLLHSI